MNKLLILLVFFTSGVFGNTSTDPGALGTVTGTVIDKQLQEPVPYATVTVKNPQGEIVTGTVSALNGTFTLEKLPQGKYTFQIQFMGYKTYTQEVVIAQDKMDLDLGQILLEPAVDQLDDVEVVGERSTIEQRIDRKVINVGKDLTTAGASASDIMGNIPTLTVDQDGNIAMRGNDNVRILVDGKPTNIPASQLLKQIPSTSIKSIELITNPSAKYNPEGMSGIINIILHKNSNLGFNGNLNSGITIGDHTRYTGSLNMNYRTGKFNFFANVGANGGKRDQLGIIDNFTNEYTENIRFTNDSESYLYKVGVDFYLNDKNTFSFFTNQNFYDSEPVGNVHIDFFDAGLPDVYQDFFLVNDNISRTYNLVYKRDLDKEGHNIELEVDHNITDETEVAEFDFSGGGDTEFNDYRDDVTSDISNTNINLDYVNPLSEKTKIELGAEARFRRSTNDYQTSNEQLEDALYDYDNNIYSFYSTFGQNFDKWSYQLGVRLEQYEVEAILNGVGIYENDYFTVYPTAFTSYKISEMKSLQLSYGRRVDRPGLNQVNPVREFSTPRITGVGNPELEPQFTNSLEMNYTQNFSKGNFTAGVFYRHIEQEINQTLLIDPEDPSRLLLTFVNSDDNSAYGFEISGRYKLFPWWSLNPSFELYSSTEKGIIGTEYLEVESEGYNFRLSQSFEVSKKLTFQLFGMYRSSTELLQINPEEMYFLNAGARYNFLKDKATLSINFNDIFDTQQFEFTSEVPYEQRGRFKGDSQNVYIGLSYNFGGGKNKAVQRKQRDDNTSEGGGIL